MRHLSDFYLMNSRRIMGSSVILAEAGNIQRKFHSLRNELFAIAFIAEFIYGNKNDGLNHDIYERTRRHRSNVVRMAWTMPADAAHPSGTLGFSDTTLVNWHKRHCRLRGPSRRVIPNILRHD